MATKRRNSSFSTEMDRVFTGPATADPLLLGALEQIRIDAGLHKYDSSQDEALFKQMAALGSSAKATQAKLLGRTNQIKAKPVRVQLLPVTPITAIAA